MEVKCCHLVYYVFMFFFPKKIQCIERIFTIIFWIFQKKTIFQSENESKAFIDTEKFVCLPFSVYLFFCLRWCYWSPWSSPVKRQTMMKRRYKWTQMVYTYTSSSRCCCCCCCCCCGNSCDSIVVAIIMDGTWEWYACNFLRLVIIFKGDYIHCLKNTNSSHTHTI